MNKYVWLFAAILTAAALIFPHSSPAAAGGPQLGVYLQEFNDNLREHFMFKGDGVLIVEVIEDTGADRAGLKNKDIIIEINGEKIGSVDDIQNEVKKTRPGEKIEMKIFRGKSKKNMLVEVTEKKRRSARHYPRKWVQFMNNDRPWIGIHMQDLNPQMAEYFKVEHGVLITEVTEDSPAERSKLKAGDVIITWEKRQIEDTKDLLKRLDKSEPGDEVTLTIMRNGKKKKKKITPVEPKDDSNTLFGFSFDEDDSGDIIFRMRNKRMPSWPFFHQRPDIEDSENHHTQRKFDMEIYDGEIGELKEELRQLRKELEELKTKEER
jgi:C-terminal processing protease CtpA/Prc